MFLAQRQEKEEKHLTVDNIIKSGYLMRHFPCPQMDSVSLHGGALFHLSTQHASGEEEQPTAHLQHVEHYVP